MNIKLVLLVLTLGTLMAAVDTTIVLLALPTITVDLNTDLLTSIWVLLAYLLVLAILTTQTGRLGDILGRSKIYNLGFILFTLASALAGASANIYELIAFRVIQAIGGAMLTANSNAIIADIFPPQERGRAYGITSLGWNIGALLGIVLGGILTTFFGWRFIFYINVPIGIIAVIIGLRNIKDINKVKSSLDITGALILGISLTFISLSVMFMAANGMSMQYLLELLVGVLLVPLFIYNEIKVKMPMINISVFKIRLLSFSLISSFLQGVGALALTFLLIMYLQGVRGLSPLDSSLLLTPSYIIASVLAPIMGRRADKGSPGLIAGIGLIFIFISLLLYYLLLTPTTPLYDILWISAITGIGSAMFWPSNAAAIMYYAPKQYYGSVSGISRTLGSIGTVLSYVMSISIATLVIPRYVAFEILLGTNALDPKTGADFVQGLHFAFLVSAVIIIIASIFSMASGIKRKLSS
ncbi:MFS transporter [Sulfurisphaera ohwakuensis]|uniref:EmrB/QacA subfamily drug resistance transporter n=1 Tax=Sulfurisphaera ohwakuensis TaxID=69656 RepID=A0A650CHY5_SULOH|nr:MFS transporter [Sulfurisphaera ohwakuensis]MBB5253596.1 EmrB/QacA subfamily drug resistance transporter [Sulfurisphaera ohwakuensis]QGR17386.1 MFS transporter [Sulfurisphaera ohwakuensis]